MGGAAPPIAVQLGPAAYGLYVGKRLENALRKAQISQRPCYPSVFDEKGAVARCARYEQTLRVGTVCIVEPSDQHTPLHARHQLVTCRVAGGDKEVAARILGIGLATLYRRLKEMEAKEGAAEVETVKED